MTALTNEDVFQLYWIRLQFTAVIKSFLYPVKQLPPSPKSMSSQSLQASVTVMHSKIHANYGPNMEYL